MNLPEWDDIKKLVVLALFGWPLLLLTFLGMSIIVKVVFL